ncbi:hypothetical protein [uncultured Paraglaciecola sp.]|uniref:hypothetical protein n=1 Tax=uncultured Paraglaciecola sp. TaxID=1765024 RepID=UPI0030D96791|tara:strand:- start:21837 stop:22589 length:753 start_codon:yes stop_codon:yes gene_type:complete
MWKLALLCNITLIFLLIVYSPIVNSDEIEVGFEPFPPLINEDGSGMVVEMLSALSANHNIDFNVQIMTYGRAKKNLKNRLVKLIGMTPFQLETHDFYEYATELNWHINTHVYLFSLDKEYFNIEKLPPGSIGTLIGNAEFLSEVVKVPLTKFVEVSHLTQLVKMLALGRLNVILFEGVAAMNTIKSLKIKDVYFKEMGLVPSSLAVSNTAQGLMLKEKLDTFLSDVENQNFFHKFVHYTPSKDSGIIIIE